MMVRINLISPKKLADQHLIAEYNEILMLLGYVKKYPEISELPENYCLGKGHIKFFKNKLLYLKKRHELIKKEMKKRGFNAKMRVNLNEFSKELVNDWKPLKKDKKIIINRLKEKIEQKPDYYNYYKEKKPKEFFIEILE